MHNLRQMDPPTRGWLVNTARKNHWRVCRWIDLDDLIQDGAMHYYRLVERYPDVTERRHMMALFKRTYTNYLNDLARKRTGEFLFQDVYSSLSEQQIIDNLSRPVLNEGPERLRLAEAPQLILLIIKKFMSESIPRSDRDYRVVDGVRETTNQWLCRIAGEVKDIAIREQLLAYCKGE